MANLGLQYELSSLCGPADLRVAWFLEKYRGYKIDPSYIDHIKRWHGGIPVRQFFDAEDGKTYRVGRFLTMFDEKSRLEPPLIASWRHRDRDVRIDWSVSTLIDEEGPSCRNLFGGEQLLPFAALYRGKLHPDEMSLIQGDCDLVCFFYDLKANRPSVVVWNAAQAHEEYRRFEKAVSEEYRRWERAVSDTVRRTVGWNSKELVRYEDFTVPVAPDFGAFLELLRPAPA